MTSRARLPLTRLAAAAARRPVHIAATPSTTSISGLVDLTTQTRAIPKLSATGPFPAGTPPPRPRARPPLTRAEITFEVLGAPYSLLAVSLPASSTLYTRRGTLLALNGALAPATSTLRVLPPLRRAAAGIPFLYRKLTSAAPLTALIATNTPNTTFAVLALDGTADWTLAQPAALLAWSGHSIVVRPREVSGRGLVALAGRGQVYQVVLAAAEEFSVRKESLLAYSAAGRRPEMARLGWTGWGLQVPRWARDPWGVRARVQELPWVGTVGASRVWGWVARARWALKTALWGEREFLRFVGPATVLLQSRTGGRLRDMLSREDMDETAVAEVAPAVVMRKVLKADKQNVVENDKQIEKVVGQVGQEKTVEQAKQAHAGTLKKVTVRNGKVEFEDSDLKEFVPR